MARREAEFVRSGVRFLNQALLEVFPNRSLDSIKSHRRGPAYKALVQEYLRDLPEESEPSGSEPGSENETATDSFRVGIVGFIEHLDPPARADPSDSTLSTLCGQLRTLSSSDIRVSLADYLNIRFPVRPPRAPAPRRPVQVVNLSSRKRRRMAYRQHQVMWARNATDTVHHVLGSKISSAPLPGDIMIPFWRAVFTSDSAASPALPPSSTPLDGLCHPITVQEVLNNYVDSNPASGPDGVTAAALRDIDPLVLFRILNLVLLCDRPPDRLLEARTSFIPKKENPQDPGDFRPITVASVLMRCLHKILAQRLDNSVEIDSRQRAFRRMDGCASNTYLLDLVLRHHRRKLRSVFIAVVDVSKAFDSVSHACIENVLLTKGVPCPLVSYIMATYRHGFTRLTSREWQSDAIHPSRGVRQGDPLSPVIFNMIMDCLLRALPVEVGAELGNAKVSASLFADDIVLMAASVPGLQSLLNISGSFLGSCGLTINVQKSQTISWKVVPCQKKVVVDERQRFTCGGVSLPTLSRDAVWTYLGVVFSPEGRCKPAVRSTIAEGLLKLSKAPLKPQQRLFALRVVLLPGLLHQLALGLFNLSVLNNLDKKVRSSVRKWLSLPHDCPNAYFHARVVDGGLGLPSLRWVVPHLRMRRLRRLPIDIQQAGPSLQSEISDCARRLNDRGALLDTSNKIWKRWRDILYSSVDGAALANSSKVRSNTGGFQMVLNSSTDLTSSTVTS